MLHLTRSHQTSGFKVRALPCAFAAKWDRGVAMLAGNARGIYQSVISKQLSVLSLENSFETTFSPGGGGV